MPKIRDTSTIVPTVPHMVFAVTSIPGMMRVDNQTPRGGCQSEDDAQHGRDVVTVRAPRTHRPVVGLCRADDRARRRREGFDRAYAATSSTRTSSPAPGRRRPGRPRPRPGVVRSGGAALAGLMVAALALAAVGVYGLLRPADDGSWRDGAAVVVERESGARFVYVDGVLHPVLNYSSALLILGSDAPRTALVRRASLAGVPRGVPLGIPGAPDLLPAARDLVSNRGRCARARPQPAWNRYCWSGGDRRGGASTTARCWGRTRPVGCTWCGAGTGTPYGTPTWCSRRSPGPGTRPRRSRPPCSTRSRRGPISGASRSPDPARSAAGEQAIASRSSGELAAPAVQWSRGRPGRRTKVQAELWSRRVRSGPGTDSQPRKRGGPRPRAVRRRRRTPAGHARPVEPPGRSVTDSPTEGRTASRPSRTRPRARELRASPGGLAGGRTPRRGGGRP